MWKQQKIMSAYITVTVMTDSIERFLNMCRHKNIGFLENFGNGAGIYREYYERGFFSAKGHLPEDKDNGAD